MINREKGEIQIVEKDQSLVKAALRVLHLEDNRKDAELVQEALRDVGYDCDWALVQTRADFLAALEQGGFDVILADYSLPSFDGLTALALAREKCPDVPFIVVSGTLGEEFAIESLKSGATDYVVKKRLSRLAPVVRRAVLEAQERAERKRAEEVLHLRTRALEAAANGVVITDREGTIIWVNAACTALTGYDAAELVGKNPRILKSGHQDEAFYRDLWTTIANGGVWQGEIVNRRKDGSLYTEEMTITPVQDQTGQAIHYIAIKQDVTERNQAEEEIRRLNEELEERVRARTAQLQAVNQELEAFTYSVAHDLRAPLRHVQGFSKVLVEDFAPKLDPAAQKHLYDIMEASETMGRLIDDLLNLTHLGRQKPSLRATGLKSLLDEALEDLESEMKGRDIQWHIGELPFVDCDPGLMKQVFLNLLSNAIKYTRPRKPAVIEVGQTMANGRPTIFVRDNGVGFNMKYADKLFGVFQRLHRKEDFEGTGVGLATVQRIIQKHGGRIWAEAELNKGATFYFSLGTPDQSECESPSTQAHHPPV